MARVFISYRTADGADKATALARDLGAVFGDDQVFLDKDDLRGGSRWADEVRRTLAGRPVLLLLVTPQLLGARGADGALRVADPDDPVRREVEAALAAGAELIPVLCDGVDRLPDEPLPAPFDHLADRTWRRLRAYDWPADVQRLVADLQALGVAPPPAVAPRRAATAAVRSKVPRAWGRTLGAAVALAALALGAALWLPGADEDADGEGQAGPAGLVGSEATGAGAAPGTPPSAASAAAQATAALDGPWQARLGDEALQETLQISLHLQGSAVQLDSAPMDIRDHPAWRDYRDQRQTMDGHPPDAVRYTGSGMLQALPGQPPRLELAFRVLTVPAGEDIDGGVLVLTAAGPGRWTGQRWLNSAQAESPAELMRP